MWKKSKFVRFVIWFCVILMVGSTIWVYVAYMFGPKQGTSNDGEVSTGGVIEDENVDWWELENSELILSEIDPENPENTADPVLITEDWEVDEMDQTIEVQLENWETELVRQGDLNDVVQIN